MRRALLAFLLVVPATAVLAPDARACGDKFMVLGRGVRQRIPRAKHPSAVVVFARPGSPAADAARAAHLEAVLAKAGHRVSDAASAEELAAALRNGGAVVVAGLADVEAAAEQARAVAPHARVVPLVDKKRDDHKAARARFPHVIIVPGAPAAYVKSVDAAMETRQAAR
jgi:hypothetical protein